MAEENPREPSMDRRRFFRRGLAEIFKPLSSTSHPLQRMAAELGKLEAARKQQAKQETAPEEQTGGPLWLRPPGAIAEKDFLSICTRGGECVKACPAHCIKIDSSGARGKGVPF